MQTYKTVKGKFYWIKLYLDVKSFCKLCLHCAISDPREVIPRPLGEQMHSNERNGILHYDFIHIGASYTGETYLLVIKDDFSSFVNLIPCKSPDSDFVFNALQRWYGMFGISLCHISDQGSHFKNKIVEELNRKLATKHHFTLPYCPWSNGTVQVVNREIRKLIRV